MKKSFVCAAFIFILLAQVCPARDWGEHAPKSLDPKVYLPGDVVHIVVGAPPDTVQIIAEMPDGQRIKLDYETRNFIWHGHWEVPMRMKKGSYTAKLTATDVQDKNFYGETLPFIIGEPALITLIDMVRTTEAKAPSRQEPEEIVTEIAPVIKPKPVVRKKAKIKIAARPARQASDLEDLSAQSAEYIVAARYYLAKNDYASARTQLNYLKRKDPANAQLNGLIDRLNDIIKAGGGNE